MAFDLTKPSMTGATIAGEFGNIRENFRAIVQGDASVFTKVRVDIAGTTTPGAFPVQLNNTHGTAGDIWGIEFTSTSFNGTSVLSGLLESGGGTAALLFFTGGATPTERMRIDGSGKVGIGRTASTYPLEVAGTIAALGPAATTTLMFSGTGTTTAAAYGNIANTTGSIVWGVESSAGGSLLTGAGAYAALVYTGNTNLQLGTGSSPTVRLTLTPLGSVVIGIGALGTTATDGFFYSASCAGAPTGTPTAFTGRVPLIYDTTNNKLWVYNGAWKGVVLT